MSDTTTNKSANQTDDLSSNKALSFDHTQTSNSKQTSKPEVCRADQADTDDSTVEFVGGAKIPQSLDTPQLKGNFGSHQSNTSNFSLSAFPKYQSHVVDPNDIYLEIDVNGVLNQQNNLKPLFPKSLRQTTAEAMTTTKAKNQILSGVSIMNSSYNPNISFSFTSKFFRPKGASSNNKVWGKVTSKEVPTCESWFSKLLSVEDRVLVMTTIDRDIVKILQKMQIKCRENKQLTLPEFLSVGFQVKSNPNKATFIEDNQEQQDGFDFNSKEKFDERHDVVDNELELLEHIRFTETNEELDTLTVSQELAKDANLLVSICAKIAGTTFLRISPSFELINKQTGRLKMGMPIWFQPNKFNSLAYWIVMFLERAVWIQFNSYIKKNQTLPLYEVRNMWVQPENKLILFKTESIPLLAEVCKSQAAIQSLYNEFEQLAKQKIQVTDNISFFDGGLSQITSFDLNCGFRNFKQKLNQFAVNERPLEQLQFILNLAQIKPQYLHDLIMVKLETIFAQMVLIKLKDKSKDDPKQKALQKKKQKQKIKKYQKLIEDQVIKEKEQQKEKEESERQRIMFMIADKKVAKKQENKINTIGVRKQDLDKLPTPVPQMQNGVSIKYIYPELPNYVDSAQLPQEDQDSQGSSTSQVSLQNCVSNEEVINKKMKKMGPLYSKLFPNSKQKYDSIFSELMQEPRRIEAFADIALSDEESDEIFIEIRKAQSIFEFIDLQKEENTEFEEPVKLTKKQEKKQRVKEAKLAKADTIQAVILENQAETIIEQVMPVLIIRPQLEKNKQKPKQIEIKPKPVSPVVKKKSITPPKVLVKPVATPKQPEKLTPEKKVVEEQKKKKSKKQKPQQQQFFDPQLNMFAQILQQTSQNDDQIITDQLMDLLSQMQKQKNSVQNPQKKEKLPMQPIQVQQIQPQVLSKIEQKYHDMISKQIKAQIKLFELKLDSVRKERENMILIIDRSIKSLFSTTCVKQYGSQANSLAVDSSDVDLAVTGLDLNYNHIQSMNTLYLHLKGLKMIQSIEFIHTASVPVIKLRADLQIVQELMRTKQENESDDEAELLPYVKLESDMRILNIDVTFDGVSLENPQASNGSTSMSLAISSVHKIKELQMKYIDLRSIVLIVKKLLAKYGLNKPYSGGLNSYSIVLMTSSFLQKFGINNVSALSQNLSEFFSFFGNYFDPTLNGMDGQNLFKLSTEQQALQEHMWVLDIQNRDNNTARTAFRISEIKQVFRNAYSEMINELQRYQQLSEKGQILNNEFEVIKKLLA